MGTSRDYFAAGDIDHIGGQLAWLLVFHKNLTATQMISFIARLSDLQAIFLVSIGEEYCSSILIVFYNGPKLIHPCALYMSLTC